MQRVLLTPVICVLAAAFALPIHAQEKDEEGKKHKVYDMKPMSWTEPEGSSLKITYLPSDPDVFKISEESGLKVLLLFPAGLLLLFFGGRVLMRYEP